MEIAWSKQWNFYLRFSKDRLDKLPPEWWGVSHASLVDKLAQPWFGLSVRKCEAVLCSDCRHGPSQAISLAPFLSERDLLWFVFKEDDIINSSFLDSSY